MYATPAKRLFICAPILLLLARSGAFAADLPNSLTPDQVACDELQLERLARRVVVIERPSVEPSYSRNPSLFLWRSSPSGGLYSGLAVTDGLGTFATRLRDERQLAIDLLLRTEGDLLNPRRTLLPQGTLTRRGQNSNLVDSSADTFLTVSLDLVGKPVEDPYLPEVPLRVNNLASPGLGRVPLVAADAAGRGVTLDRLAEACHDRFTEFDQKIFTILSRTVRVSSCAALPDGCSGASGTTFNVSVFRGAETNAYRANVYIYNKGCPDVGPCTYEMYAKVALELTMHRNDEGKLTTGQAIVLPTCAEGQTTGCSEYPIAEIGIYIMPPLWAGHERQDDAVFAASGHLNVAYPGSPDNILSTPVDWQALLAGTPWN